MGNLRPVHTRYEVHTGDLQGKPGFFSLVWSWAALGKAPIGNGVKIARVELLET